MQRIITPKFLSILIAFFCLNITSQNTNKGIIEYNVRLIKNEKKMDLEKSKNPSVYNILKNQKIQKAILLFKNEKSQWSKVKEMEKDVKVKLNLTSIMMGGDAKYYTDSKNKMVLIEKEFSGEKFIIKNNLLDWKLMNETKLINNYVVYKALSTQKIETRKGIRNVQITAWYCPKIPLRFGPKEYSGLPGLILELDYGKRLNFLATRIELNPKKEIKINNLAKGKRVTLKEYNSIVKKSTMQYRKRIGLSN